MGIFIETDQVKDAMKTYYKAALQGNAEAQYKLGECYEDGLGGLEEDPELAFEWYKKAAEQNYPDALYVAGLFYEDGDVIEQDIPKAFQYYNQAAELGDSGAQLHLSHAYRFGDGIEMDPEMAFYYASLAADSNDSVGLLFLSDYYRFGIGTDVNYEKAVEYAQLAVDQEYIPAYSSLGWLYENGQGVPEDKQKAFDLYMEAARRGDCSGQFNLGMWYSDQSNRELYEEENPMWRNSLEESFKWYRLAAENEDADVTEFNSLAECYQYGCGVKQDYDQAIIWYQKSVDLGDEEAQENLDKLFAKKRLIDQLSSEEHEYWDEMKACSDYYEEIPDHERRLLEKLRKLLGITEERAKEIEKL
ncbi:MAG: SEL1-like repeat protein [Parabacteroides sp.]|nr:SEL1-like repeat protein [Parabacteroides sp.]